jgi:hypothetical protein
MGSAIDKVAQEDDETVLWRAGAVILLDQIQELAHFAIAAVDVANCVQTPARRSCWPVRIRRASFGSE